MLAEFADKTALVIGGTTGIGGHCVAGPRLQQVTQRLLPAQVARFDRNAIRDALCTMLTSVPNETFRSAATRISLDKLGSSNVSV